MAGISQISGLVANFDVKGAVEELLAPQKAAIDALQSRQKNEQARQEALLALNDKLLQLKHKATSLSDASSFFRYTASLASNTSVPASQLLEVTGTDSVAAGTHTIVVQQLAQALRIGSSAAVQDAQGVAVADASTPLGLSGSFSINGKTVTVSAGDGLLDIARKINDLGAGVQASVLQVAAGDLRLVLTAEQTGAAGFTISGADLDPTGPLAGLQLGASGQTNAYQVLQNGQDAIVVIDGLSLSRTSNRITDALSGITLDLRGADPTTTITMTIGIDREELRARVQAFVDAYNEVAKFLNDQFRFDAEKQSNGALANEPVLTSIQASLQSMLLAELPGLASDRNSLVKIGIEPDAEGMLRINDARFSEFLNNAPEAIRDVFTATATSSNGALSFLTPGFATPSGTYQVTITQAATRAEAIGTADLSAGLAADETITITETATGRSAQLLLTAGMTRDAIVQALNQEFARSITEVRRMSAALLAGGVPATASTSFAALNAGVAAGDTITIQGTDRLGRSIHASFTITDPATTTLGDLLQAIEQAYGGGVVASIDASGRIQLAEATAGDSQMTFTLTANNEGGGALSFGTPELVAEGRGPLALEAVAVGSGVAIRSKHFGSAAGFSIAQSTNGLGIADGSYAGTDVAGSINGYAAQGRGQILTGTAGPVDGMSVRYTGTATGNVGSLQLAVGAGAALQGVLDLFANPFTGMIRHAIEASQSTAEAIQQQIDRLQEELALRRRQLLAEFARMEKAMSVFQSTGDYLMQQIQAMQKANR